MPYVSDEHVVINIQGLRTVQREDWKSSVESRPYRLLWSYKGQQNCYRYASEAERDAMYDALRKALTESKQQKQVGGYHKIDAIKTAKETGDAWGLKIGLHASKAIVEALEPIMRSRVSQGEGDADNPK